MYLRQSCLIWPHCPHFRQHILILDGLLHCSYWDQSNLVWAVDVEAIGSGEGDFDNEVSGGGVVRSIVS